MLQILRRKAQSTFVQIIVVVIALVFIFWGVGDMSNSRQAALVVNGEEISFQQFQQAYDRAYQRVADQFGGNLPKGLADTLNIKQQVINQLVQTTLLRQGAEEMGIVVSGEEIREVIENMVQFQEDGAFNMERYKTLLAANRMAPTKFEASMRFDRISEVAAREIGNFSAVATDFEVEQIYSEMNEKVALKYVEIKPELFEKDVVPDDASLSEWFNAVKDNYKTDPQLKLKYLPFVFSEIGEKIEVDEAKIIDYYENNLENFKIAEQRHARHILLKAGDDDPEEVHSQKAAAAEDIRSKALAGSDFADLAKEYSEGPSKDNGGDLGFFSAGRMVPAFDNAVFNMAPGDISEVVKTRFGYHIIYLEEIKPAGTRNRDEARAEIIRNLQQKEAEALAFQVANDAYEGIIAAGSLDKYAESQPGSDIRTTDFFTKATAPAILKQDSQFLNAAFNLNKGELSSLIKGQSGYVILFAEDIQEPEIPSFAAIKDTLTTDYKQEKAREIAKTVATDMLAALRSGNQQSIESASADSSLVVMESGFLGRSDKNSSSNFPSELFDSAFLLSSSSPLPENPGQVGDNYYVYIFSERQLPTAPENTEELAEYKNNLLQFKQQQLLSAWLRHMEIDADITKHQSL